MQNKKSKNRSQTREKQDNARLGLAPIAARSWAKKEANSNDEKESADCGYGNMSSVIGPFLVTEEHSDDVTKCHSLGDPFGVPVGRGRGPRAVVRHAVYTSEQMLEIHPKTAIFCNFSGPSARRLGESTRSARHCSIRRSDMNRVRPARPRAELQWVHRDCNINFR
jgi:hypothetical protein